MEGRSSDGTGMLLSLGFGSWTTRINSPKLLAFRSTGTEILHFFSIFVYGTSMTITPNEMLVPNQPETSSVVASPIVDPTSSSVVLLAVDMQNGFLGQKSSHVVPAVVRLVEHWKKAGGTVVFTQFFNKPGSAYERLIGWKRLETSPETDICAELKPFLTTVIRKEIYSAFTPEFIELASRSGWTTIVLCGVATDGCVLKTAVDAFERGLTPIVVRDACASHAGEQIHAMGLALLERFIGRSQLVTSDRVMGG
jgi:nicotinamidase-related amidase